jgi:hypothetical protein
MRCQRGIVLFFTLMILSVLSMLILFEMQSVFLYYQSINQFIKKKESFYHLELQAKQLALKNWQRGDKCVVGPQDSNEIIKLLLSKGCSYKSKKILYTYLVEDLGDYPCLQTIINKERFATRHFQVSIVSKEEGSALLQLRFAELAFASLPCTSKLTIEVPQGILSWRYVRAPFI